MLKAVLFDFDGVLIDSYDSTITYFQETFRNFDLPVPKRDAFESILGLRTIDMFKHLLPDYTDEQIEPILLYSQKLSLEYVLHIKLIPQAKEVLETLQPRHKLGLITSRGKRTVQPILKLHNLTKYFSVVFDREDVTQHKPHPEGILKALDALKTINTEAVYIGDMPEDAKAAQNAGVTSVMITAKDDPAFGEYRIPRLSDLPRFLEQRYET